MKTTKNKTNEIYLSGNSVANRANIIATPPIHPNPATNRANISRAQSGSRKQRHDEDSEPPRKKRTKVRAI